MVAGEQVTDGESMPVSPFARLFSLPGGECFNVVTIASKSKANPSAVIEGLKNTLVKHPRFSSILDLGDGGRKGKPKWIPTKVNVEEHVIVPNIDPTIEDPDQFLEDYTSYIAISPMDMSKPLWEFHILRLKTSHAESVAVARFHHSLGDGMSLMSLLLASSRKTCDLEALPTLLAPKEKEVTSTFCWSLVAGFWFILRLMFHTCVEVFNSILSFCYIADIATILEGKKSEVLSPNKLIHRIISLDDVKFVKTAMNMTVNDVLLGIVQAGLSRYLHQRKDREPNSKSIKPLEKYRLRGAVFFNLRPNRNIEDLANMMEKGSKSRWGNHIGYVLIPLWLKPQKNIFEYIRQSKSAMDRKKISLEPLWSYALLKLTVDVFGFTALKNLMSKIFSRSTMIFSNVAGPPEEITIFDHQIVYVASCMSGLPQALVINIQSYVNKVIINIGVDLNVIPDPHHLCDLIVEALHMMKSTSADTISTDKNV